MIIVKWTKLNDNLTHYVELEKKQIKMLSNV